LFIFSKRVTCVTTIFLKKIYHLPHLITPRVDVASC
jgi:hypothetical protein